MKTVGRKVDADEPLYRRMRLDIERRILSGEWPPGHRIPVEHEFTSTYKCSRMTVNKVLTGLADAGLIERRRRAGSFVSAPRAQAAVLAIPDIQSAIQSRGEDYRYELLAERRRLSTREDMKDLLLAARQRVIHIQCRHFANGVPFTIEERLINLAEVPEAAAVDFSVTPPGTWLLTFVPWLEAEHRILARQAGQDWGALLNLPQDTACLVVERRTWRTGSALTYVRQIFQGDRYFLTARFAPRDGATGQSR